MKLWLQYVQPTQSDTSKAESFWRFSWIQDLMQVLSKDLLYLKGIILKELDSKESFSTLAGTLDAQQMVTLWDVRLPEFDKNRHILQQRALVFDNENCKCDIILAIIFLSKTGIKLDYQNGNMEWYYSVLPMRPSHGLTLSDFLEMEESYFVQLEDELFGKDWLHHCAT